MLILTQANAELALAMTLSSEQSMNAGSPHERLTTPVWYAARTRPKSEHIAAAGLARLGGVEVYCP